MDDDCRVLIVGRLTPPTVRQLEMLKLASNGLANKEIANKLGLSEQTVKNYFNTLYRKLGARDRAHAVALGLKMRLIDHKLEAKLKRGDTVVLHVRDLLLPTKKGGILTDNEVRCGMQSCQHCDIGSDHDSMVCRFSGNPEELLQDEMIPQEMCLLIKKMSEGG